VGIGAEDLGAAIAQFKQTGNGVGIEGIAKRIAGEAQAAIDADLAKNAPCDEGHFKWSCDLAIITLVGIITGIYAVDVETFSEKIVEFTKAAVTSGAQVEDARNQLVRNQALFLKNLLAFLDGKRYEPKFQFIYAVWPLQNQIPNLGIIRID
jgi:hypothetical protein